MKENRRESDWGNKMNILEQCKICEKRPMCRLGEHEYYQVAFENGCPSFKQKQKKTVTLTNFERITESPEALAKQMVYSAFDEFDGEEWFGITGNKIRESFKNKEEAVAATLKWLNEEVEK